MHCAYFCVCGVLDDLSCGLFDFLFLIVFGFVFLCDLLDVVCVVNRIAFIRLRGVALFDVFDIVFNSISGVLARSCGFMWDVRLFSAYELYCVLCFNFVFCVVGDAFDRFMCRLFDMRNACFVVKQVLLFFCFFGFMYFF